MENDLSGMSAEEHAAYIAKLTDTTGALIAERGKTHGDYTDHARITQSIKKAMQDEKAYWNLTPCQRETLEMIAHKIGRILAGNPNFEDHWQDIAGYARLVADRCPK